MECPYTSVGCESHIRDYCVDIQYLVYRQARWRTDSHHFRSNRYRLNVHLLAPRSSRAHGRFCASCGASPLDWKARDKRPGDRFHPIAWIAEQNGGLDQKKAEAA